MMHRVRYVLCWLLAALLLTAGAPTRAEAACAGGGDGVPACCRSAQPDGCCQDNATHRCDCGKRKPLPTPPPSAPKPPQFAPIEPDLALPPQPRPPPATRALPPAIAAAFARDGGLLPARSRQEALSVWRL